MFDGAGWNFTVSEFLGVSDVHTEDENEDDVIGKEMKIGTDGIYYNSSMIADEPIFTVSLITYDDLLINHRTNPNMLRIEEGSIYKMISISDASNNKAGLIQLILIEDHQIIYYRLSKY